MTSSFLVPPSQIQGKLDELWNTKDGKNKVRASLFNIIFFIKNASPREEYIRKITSKLVEKFPARIFLISSDPTNSENSLKTAVSVMTTEQGEYSLTCDLIEISATGKGEEQVPFILLPNIIPDLPVFLIWTEDPGAGNALCETLKSFATRIIFDSESAEDLCLFAQSVLKIGQDTNSEIADLNWARLESWRDIVATTFSDSDKLETLKQTTHVTITYNSHETPFFCHTKIQSIYLQAWLASCLKWVPDPKSRALDLKRFVYSFKGTPIEVELKEVRNSSLPPGMILSLNLEMTGGFEFLFERNLVELHQVTLKHFTKDSCFLPSQFMISKGESGQSLIKEICHKGTSSHYKSVLQLISHWSVGISCC